MKLFYDKKGTSSPRREKSLPLVMQLANNPRVKIAHKIGDEGILVGINAMMKAGVQPEFVASNFIQLERDNLVILRANDPPQYNKRRSSKSGDNLSKTSKQGFFKGAVPEQLRFARLSPGRTPRAHHYKDAAHLQLKPTDPEYQFTMPLDVTMGDILREIGSNGDLFVICFDEQSGWLRLKYKEGHGPRNDKTASEGFVGQFVINLYEGDDTPQFYSREWDRPEYDTHWDATKHIILKPANLSAVPDSVYQKVFKHSFKLRYIETDAAKFDTVEVHQAKVFANRPRCAVDFKQALGLQHKHYSLIDSCTSLEEILATLKEKLPEEEASADIIEAYTKGGSIIAGDWDGMALGHPITLAAEFREVIDTFAPGDQGITNQHTLLTRSNEYLQQIKTTATSKHAAGIPTTAFEDKVLSINSMNEIVSGFCLARAGCITVHEFVFQQVLNAAYRDKSNAHYGEKYDTATVQSVMDKLLTMSRISSEDLHDTILSMLQNELRSAKKHIPEPVINKLVDHLIVHLLLAQKLGLGEYTLPHLNYDPNVHDLYQHGFDMRNPYGCNLDGAWLLVSGDGGVFYGETQEQLIELLLTGDFLQKNCIDINHQANMSAGWGRVIQKQLELHQTIPAKTLQQYMVFKKSQELQNSTTQMSEIISPKPGISVQTLEIPGEEGTIIQAIP